MKILHLMMNSAEASGVVTFVKELSKALEHLECKSESVKCKAIECEVWTEDTLSTNHYPLITNYDVVHIHGLWRPVFHRMCMKASEQGVPVVWSTHGMTAPWSMAHKRWKKLVAWWLYQKWDLKRAAVIHSTVEQEREWNRALGLGLVGSGQCVVGSREVVAPLGTNLPEREKVEGGRLKVERRNGKVLLFVGRVYPVKALDRLIEAFARIIYLGQQLYFMICENCLFFVPAEGEVSEKMRGCGGEGERKRREPSAGMALKAILKHYLRRLDNRFLLRYEARISCNPIHQVNKLAHDRDECPFRCLRSRHS